MTATSYPHELGQMKRAINAHSAQCDDCEKFFFKTDLRPYFLPGSQTTAQRFYLCTRCRGRRADAVYDATSKMFGVDIEVCKALHRCLKSSKALSDKSMGRKAHALTLDDIIRLWIMQDGICNLSGLPMQPNGDDMAKPSLDRIDSQGSYVMGNVQLVSVAVNMMKGPLPQEAFILLCRAVASKERDFT